MWARQRRGKLAVGCRQGNRLMAPMAEIIPANSLYSPVAIAVSCAVTGRQMTSGMAWAWQPYIIYAMLRHSISPAPAASLPCQDA